MPSTSRTIARLAAGPPCRNEIARAVGDADGTAASPVTDRRPSAAASCSAGRPPQRQRRAAGPAAAPNQLAAVDRDHGPLFVVEGLVAGQQVAGGNHAEPRRGPLAEGGVVAA